MSTINEFTKILQNKYGFSDSEAQYIVEEDVQGMTRPQDHDVCEALQNHDPERAADFAAQSREIEPLN